jgi:hypothetical protein
VRRSPNLTEKLAAALLEIDRLREARGMARAVQYEEAKGLTTEQILARWTFDHYPVLFVDREFVGSVDISHIHHPTNLSPRPHLEHRDKTLHVDVPAIAKRKRIVKRATTPRTPSRIPSRPFPRRHRPLNWSLPMKTGYKKKAAITAVKKVPVVRKRRAIATRGRRGRPASK